MTNELTKEKAEKMSPKQQRQCRARWWFAMMKRPVQDAFEQTKPTTLTRAKSVEVGK